MKKDLENPIKLENGRMNPILYTLEKIANALGISSSELLK